MKYPEKSDIHKLYETYYRQARARPSLPLRIEYEANIIISVYIFNIGRLFFPVYFRSHFYITTEICSEVHGHKLILSLIFFIV